jgi:hypothetical protein
MATTNIFGCNPAASVNSQPVCVCVYINGARRRLSTLPLASHTATSLAHCH